MARSRSRGRRPTKSRRPKADWVYRGHLLNSSGGNSDALGTYEHQIVPHSTGIVAAQSHVLYDSRGYIAETGRAGFVSGGAQAILPRAARAEGSRPTILAVEGLIYVEPSTWALGNLIAMGFRIGVFEQDVITGSFAIDAEYSMWTNLNPIGPRPNQWANNQRGRAWEHRLHWGFKSDGPVFTQVHVRWKGRRSLFHNECFGLYTELEGTSVGTRCQYWLRSLVVDED